VILVLAEIPVWWYLARSTGIVALFAMGLSVALGVFLSTRLAPDRRRPAWLLDVHRWASGVCVVALLAHLGSLVADSYLTFGWRQILLPYTSQWEPVAVSVGVVGLWALVIGTAAAIMRKRLTRRAWLLVHRLTYASFWLSCIHAGLAGTDSGNRLFQGLALVMALGVVFLVLYRVLVTEAPKRSARSSLETPKPSN
jgi:methionine sulfoxide reductase heme-binding subunit